MKAVADEKMVYVYFEQELEEGQDVSPFDLFIDADGNSETGASCYLWPEACGWDDPDDTDDILAPYQEKLDEISGFTSNAGVVTSGVAKVELAIERAAFGDKLGKTINIGILLYEGDSWVDNGFLPQDGEGMLAVKLP